MKSNSYEMLESRPIRSHLSNNLHDHRTENLDAISHPSNPLSSVKCTQNVQTSWTRISNTIIHWRWEFVASFLALAMIFIIFGTLYPHDGRPLPQWPFQISVNALLSVYTMVLKAALSFVTVSCIGQLQWVWFSRERPLYDLIRYDDAGRGAWGSTQLLWSQHLSQPLTSLAGLLMILSLGIDPSIQQLSSPSDCSVALHDRKALLPRTNRFNDPSETPTFEYDIDSAMLRGISDLGNGLYPECTTGNCTFPVHYGTMGYCSSCEDSSNEITTESLHYSSFGANSSDDTSNSCPGNITTWSVKSSLPNDTFVSSPWEPIQLNVTFNATECSSWPGTNYFNAEVASMDIQYHETSRGHQERPDRIVVKILAGKTTLSNRNIDVSTGQTIPGCQNKSSGSWHCGQYGAATCTLQPCVRVYNATVEAGHLTEHLVAESGDLEWGKDPVGNSGLGMIDKHCLTSQDKIKLKDQGYAVDAASRWLPYSVAWAGLEGNTARVEMTNSLFDRKCLYFFDTGFVSSMGPFIISAHLQGTLESLGSHGSSLSLFEGSQILQHIYNSGRTDLNRIQEIFSNLSDSLTTYVRTNGDSNYSDAAVGQVYHYATCMQVQWQWMAFPSLMTVLTIALFITTICFKNPGQFPVWKTSPLPWLMCNSGSSKSPSANESPRSTFDVGIMEKEAKEILVTWKSMPNPHFQLRTSD
ncbi:hypothetical protein F5B19DRAFT_64039 [Rostrohypoxylon terebratum]|nr:hypothetical protein F5B19DRAFT_64039 [Rostrohypoxylon terebratum]